MLIYLSIYIYIDMYVHLHVHVHVYVHVHVHVHVDGCRCARVHARMCVCMYHGSVMVTYQENKQQISMKLYK